MRSLAVGIAIIITMCVCHPVNADDLTAAEKAARNFAYETIGIGTSVKDFLKQFPGAQLVESDESAHYLKYAAKGNDGKLILVEFFRGNAAMIMLMVERDIVTNIGGYAVLLEKMVDTFGTPSLSSNNVHAWDFPRINRRMALAQNDSGAAVQCRDKEAIAQMNQVKANNLNLGF
jgi:hypothetical protein